MNRSGEAEAASASQPFLEIAYHTIDGQRLRVGVRRGAGSSAPPLLVFNGIGASIELVEPFLAALPDHQAIVFDVPGVGGSPVPRLPYRMRDLARLAARLLDALDVPCVDVLGVSWGGAPAQQFAFQFPDRCRRLVLAATSTGHLMVPASPRVLVKMITPRRYRDPGYVTRIAGSLYGGRLRDAPERARDILRHVRWSSDYGYYLQLFATLGWTSVAWLPLLRQPTLVMAGRDDPLVPLINARILERLIPRARLVVLDDGHLFLVTSPEESARWITGLLAATSQADHRPAPS